MRALLIVVLTTIASAQTYVVDASNGPGTNFLDLPNAIAAVPNGAVLLVRPGTYSGFSLVGKGLSILGESTAVRITGPVVVTGTTPGQPVKLRQLTWAPVSFSGTDLLALGPCQDQVLLDACHLPGNYGCLGGTWPCFQTTVCVRATSCQRLAIRDSVLGGTTVLSNCNTCIESSTLNGEPHSPGTGTGAGRTALLVSNGTTTIAGGSHMRGGDGYVGPSPLYWYAIGNGIGCYGDLRLLDGTVRCGNNLGPGPVTGFGGGIAITTVSPWDPRISPRATQFSLNSLFPTLPANDVMPQLTGNGAPPGGTLAATVASEPGDLAILVVGLPGPPVTITGVSEPFWLDATAHVFVAIGTHTAGSPITASVLVPPIPGFVGVCLNWQAACLGPVTGFQATNPVVTLVR